MVECIRVYANGSFAFEPRAESDVAHWIEYNTKWRGGNALFVNGKHIPNTGYASPEDVKIITQEIADGSVVNKKERFSTILHKAKASIPEPVDAKY